jgi:hypothetical protein
MSKAQNEGEFDDKYVTTNLKAGAPRYSADIVRKMYHELLELDQEEFKHYGYAVLVCSTPYIFILSSDLSNSDSC